MNFEKCIKKCIEENVSIDKFLYDFWKFVVIDRDILKDQYCDYDDIGDENTISLYYNEYAFIRPFISKMTPGFVEKLKSHRNINDEMERFFQETMFLFYPFNKIEEKEIRQEKIKEVTLENLARDVIRDSVWQKVKADQTIKNKETGFHNNLEKIDGPKILMKVLKFEN